MQIIPIASGKGGVGKSLLSANLAISLGKAGKKVLLVDLDLGASNLHLVIGQQAPKKGIGTFLTGAQDFDSIITDTDYENVQFIAGDSEIPGMSSIKTSQKNLLIKRLAKCDNVDYLILDLGAGTHLSILDFFLMSPQGIIVTAPTVTATLNGYLFLKNAMFRMMHNTFKKGTKGYDYMKKLRSDSASLQRLYVPRLLEELQKVDPENAALFIERKNEFHPRLVMNCIDNPVDAEKAQKIRRSCAQYLGLDLEHLGVIYRDSLQDRALASRLPITVYKPQAVISQAIFRIADRILESETRQFDANYDVTDEGSDSFQIASEEALDDYSAKMAYVEELLGTGALTPSELAETVKMQQLELNQLKKENTLLKAKLLKAATIGFKV